MSYNDKSGIAKFFGSYGKALLYILVTMVYSIIGIAFFVGGSFLIDFTLLMDMLSGDFSALLDPTGLFGSVTSIIGFVLIIVGFLFLILAGFSAFVFTATRGPKYSKDVSFFGAFGGAFKILIGFILFLIILIGLSIGSMYIGNTTVVLIINMVVFIFATLTPMAMMFRIVDFITDKV
ncbi:MAG: hypothetical protein ACTSQE_14070 [Candidatus Heimdallarchaeaceae archaeon]